MSAYLLSLPLSLALGVWALVWVVPRLVWRLVWGDGLWGRDAAAAAEPWTAILSFIEWDGAWQRPQHLATELARGGESTVYCSPVRAHNALGQGRRWWPPVRESVSENLTVVRPRVLPLASRWRWVRWLNTLLVLDALIDETNRRGGAPERLLANSPEFWAPFLLMPARVRVCDVMDELTRMPGAGDAAARERWMMRGADAVTAGTRSVARLKEERARVAVRYVACGVDAARFAQAGEPAADLVRLPGPVLGFFGALNERIDEALVARLARAMPEASVALIGPKYRSFPELEVLANVHFLGMRRYEDLPVCLAAFDVALVPYRLSDGVEFVQPVKVLEYLAGGKPVVSTAIPDVAELYGETVRIADSAEAFLRGVREALAEKGARAEEYRAVAARARSWAGMADEFREVFEAVREKSEKRGPGVVHVLHGTHLGGAEEMVLNLCAAGRGWRGMVAYLGRGERVLARTEERGVAHAMAPMGSRLDFGGALRLVPTLRAFGAAAIHTHTSRTNLVGRIAGRLAGLPVVTTVHTAVARDVNDVGRSNRLNAWVERRTRRWSSALVCVSEHNRRELLREGEARGRVVHVPNGVRVDSVAPDEGRLRELREELGIGEDDRVVGMVASMRPRKGPEVLLRAFARLTEGRGGARLLMVGSAEFVESRDYLGDLKALARELGIAERVVFAGHRDDAGDLMD